jgi:serine/threonine-protein kinase
MECPACHTPNIDGARFCAKCGAPLPAQKSEADPLIGAVVGGRFRVTGILGEGGMGRVYSGEQQMGTSVRKVAIKTLLAEHARDPQTVARFMRECGTVSELEHPNTIKVYDFGQTNTGELYIAMELLTGKSLERVLEEEHAVAPERVDKILGQICGSLAEAHEKGIVHRDLKPANIQLLTRAGEEDYVKVLDFGIAKKEESKQDQKLTRQGTILGTPPYMSPEQFKGTELDARSDIYSLGVMAYEMLSGRLPFDADTPWQWATQHMTAQPFPFETIPIAANVPAKMKAAVMRALSKDREQRPQSVKEFYEEFTLGAVRMSILANAPRMTSTPDLPASGAGRSGQTQIGEPLFVGGGPSAPGRTMVDSSPSALPGSSPAVSAAPTGGGQVMAAPPPSAAKKKGGAGPIIGAVAVVAVLGIVGAVFMMKKSPAEDPSPAIPIPSGAPVALTADPPTTSSATVAVVDSAAPSAEPSATAPTKTGGTTAGTTTNANDDRECQAAINMANGNNVTQAVSHYHNCKGSRQGEARSAISAAATREVKSKKCGGKRSAQAAASIGAPQAMSLLPSSCR